MILYGFTCPACWSTAEVFLPAEQRDSTLVWCSFCADLNHAVQMQRSFSVPAIRGSTVGKS